MIKLLATDLDGTLFMPKRRLTLMTRGNARLLRDFSAAGGRIVLITGRNKRIAMKIGRKLRIPLAVLGCNGAFIFEDGAYVESHPIDKHLLTDIYIQLRANYGIVGWLVMDNTESIKVSATDATKLMTTFALVGNIFNGVYKEKYIASEQAVISTMAHNDVYKLMPIFGIGSKGRQKARAAQIALGDIYKGRLTFALADVAMEITAANVNKASALSRYIDKAGIRPDEIAVIGDSYNDLPVLKAFPNSFAMASGEDEAKAQAAHIVKSVADLRPFLLPDGRKS